MQINKVTIGQLPQKALGKINSLGEDTISFVKEKSDSFSKTTVGNFCNQHNLNKNTLVGCAIILAAGSFVVSIAKKIINKTEENKRN